jgi:hypothetical protein
MWLALAYKISTSGLRVTAARHLRNCHDPDKGPDKAESVSSSSSSSSSHFSSLFFHINKATQKEFIYSANMNFS